MTKTQVLVKKLEEFAGKTFTAENRLSALSNAALYASELTTQATRRANAAMVGVGEEPINGQAINSSATISEFASRARFALDKASLLERLEADGAQTFEGPWGPEPIESLRETVTKAVKRALETLGCPHCGTFGNHYCPNDVATS